MIFYNPFFMPPFPKYPAINSTTNAQSVHNSENLSTYSPKDETSKSINEPQENSKSQSKKQSFLSLDFFNKYLQESDNLIILAILYFLYQQKSNNNNLMLCLLLLLLD